MGARGRPPVGGGEAPSHAGRSVAAASADRVDQTREQGSGRLAAGARQEARSRHARRAAQCARAFPKPPHRIPRQPHLRRLRKWRTESRTIRV